MNRLLAMSFSLVFLASQSVPADANEHGGGNGRSVTAPPQRSAPVQQPAPRQTFQQPPNTAYAQRTAGYAPAQSYQRQFQQPQGNNAFQAHPSAPQPMFRNQVDTAPTYRTAPTLRSNEPTSWSARFAQTRPGNTGGGGGQNVASNARFGNLDAGVSVNAGNGGGSRGGQYISWHQRFNHGSDNGYWHHNGGGREQWNNATTNIYNNSGAGSSGANLTVPILAVAAAITFDAFASNRNSCSCDSSSNSATVIDNNYNSGSPPDNGQAAMVDASAPANQPVTQVQVALADTHAPYVAPPDLPAYDPGPVEVHPAGNAPADEYFGSMHMSVLGIRNSINDINVRAVGAGEERGHGMLHMLLFTEEAFRDWQHQYPNDSWIIVNGYEMVDDFAKLDAETPDENPHVAAIHGIDLGNLLDTTYPGNQFASK